jgi:adenylosuccinate lyase
MINACEFISPLDFRYAKRELKEKAMRYLSEEAKIRYELQVEAAYIKALAKLNICPKEIVREVEQASKSITAEHVQREEEKTRHETKALVNCLKASVSERAKPFIHLGLTSYDVIDTANALRYKHFVKKALIPELRVLEKLLIELALRHKATPQIGRTHGQHAEPITFGFALAEYVHRLGTRILEIEKKSDALQGKISGCVGAYNAITLFCKDAERLEELTLKFLGLKPARYSTQITPREPLADFVHALISTMGVLANLADDIRHLQRSEIAEVAEFFASEQVGSSTMPHKRNPVAFENIKSFWKAFVPRMLTVYMDQISEHQRDLTNSASERFVPEILFACLYVSHRMKNAIAKLYVDEEAMLHNLKSSSDKIVAEPLYILLALQGLPDAHEEIRRLALKAGNSNLLELAFKDRLLTIKEIFR